MLSVEFEKTLGGFHLRPRFVAEDELVVLLGPSGSGKSLTLRAIAGLLRPDRGRIELPQGVVFDSQAHIEAPPQERGVGYVVQNLALFPHLTVAENIGFAIDRWKRPERQQRVAELVELLGLQGLESRLPRFISGGQQQRVALGRALAARPRVLLLDEPFTALDTQVRHTLRREVARLRRQLGLLALFVTHDLQEAYALGDSIAVYDQGEVLQFGQPRGGLQVAEKHSCRPAPGRTQHFRRHRRRQARGLHGGRDAVVPRKGPRRGRAGAGHESGGLDPAGARNHAAPR